MLREILESKINESNVVTEVEKCIKKIEDKNTVKVDNNVKKIIDRLNDEGATFIEYNEFSSREIKKWAKETLRFSDDDELEELWGDDYEVFLDDVINYADEISAYFLAGNNDSFFNDLYKVIKEYK